MQKVTDRVTLRSYLSYRLQRPKAKAKLLRKWPIPALSASVYDPFGQLETGDPMIAPYVCLRGTNTPTVLNRFLGTGGGIWNMGPYFQTEFIYFVTRVSQMRGG